jgi:hypothetical protein
MTPLLDAVGRAINETGIRLNELKEADRPGGVPASSASGAKSISDRISAKTLDISTQIL